jgi:galactonate dehydratase
VRITSIETFQIPPRWLFLRIGTDEGLVGWGEPIVEGRAEVVQAAVAVLAERLIGADPLRIEDHWQSMQRGHFYRGGPDWSSAVSGVDHALWDIAGQHRGAPVHELLGGPVRDKVRMYCSIHGATLDELAAAARAAIAAGYTAVKLGHDGKLNYLESAAGTEEMAARVATVREAIGSDADLAVDLHGRSSIALSRRLLPLLEPSRPLFVEEPLRPEYSDQIGKLVAGTPVPIATGERLYSRWDFRPILDAGVTVVQPDPSHAGGISEVRRIAAQAEVHDAVLAPHCPLGPIALAACLQLDFAVPNFLIQEQSLGIHDHTQVPCLADPAVLALHDGHITRPTAPGLGITVDEDAVRTLAKEGHRFRTPQWRYPDGSFAEW